MVPHSLHLGFCAGSRNTAVQHHSQQHVDKGYEGTNEDPSLS